LDTQINILFKQERRINAARKNYWNNGFGFGSAGRDGAQTESPAIGRENAFNSVHWSSLFGKRAEADYILKKRN